jgi:uncharacterized protein (DUF849 family)
MLLKIALNGARPKSQNQFIPQSLEEIRKEVIQLYKIGCKIFHIHCYDKNGTESLKPEDVNNLIAMVKKISPGILVGISTGDWIEPELEKRLGYIRQWENLPDFASVNMIEEDAVVVSRALIGRGIMVEAGLNELKAAEKFVESNLAGDCGRVLIEPEEENFESALETINVIEKILDSNHIHVPRLLHGFNSVAWDILREARKRGYDGRIGMEDTVYLESGKSVSSNFEIIQEAMKIIDAFWSADNV